MTPVSKQEWRRRIVASRRSVDADVRVAESLKLCHAAADSARGTAAVAAYVPVGSEPGSLDLLDALRRESSVVMVPVAGEPGPLHWAEYTGRDSLKAARYGLLEPTGEILDPASVSRCDVVFIPALAVDLRGVRLGRGAGFYDRTLDLVGTGVPVVAVVRDGELVDELPEEQHDRRCSHALTPSRGLVSLSGE
ncbi:5-formyltetrahydrofolate cyclo-ligase [Rhodococcoides kyotonense]|uniref:5-formyltetrahydrofolate cyclo-ligase n=1 Tax=Rhodococcoides kyotonense TaxID=398843 RepID=A0A239ENA5_9NOCA|nr:5-formyltetrahydrofolate cyclo-ligase [Rhodococcus kyotonensis]SNS45523.1 5-formyltetrahydrofolate cyclo-ligase [Rhodococcus kyotonensis]